MAHAPADDPTRAMHLQREITTLIAAGKGVRAAALADAALARGERGNMSSDANVLELLSAYGKGPDAYAAFKAGLTPTHSLQRLREDEPSTTVGLVRGRHRGNFRTSLHEFDGRGMWAMILEKRPPPGAEHDHAAVCYLQAAGTADAMTVEIREPGGQYWGAVSVRSTLGRPDTAQAPHDIAIVLPRSTEMLSRSEVFTAEQAATLFETYYLTDAIPYGYARRPVEGFAADGGYVPPPHPGICG